MQFRLLLGIAIAGGTLTAADLSGHWTGTLDTNGMRTTVYLSLKQQDGKVSGTFATSGSPTVSIDRAEPEGDRLAFEVRDATGRMAAFRLTLTEAQLTGESKAGGQVSKVLLTKTPDGRGIGGPFLGRDVESPPALIRKVEPEYTEEARKARFQGTVLVAGIVETNGEVTNIEVRRGLGLGLDEKAIEAVKQWKFRPAQKGGAPVRMWVTIEVNFRL